MYLQRWMQSNNARARHLGFGLLHVLLLLLLLLLLMVMLLTLG
jgi:hypothetical protein